MLVRLLGALLLFAVACSASTAPSAAKPRTPSTPPARQHATPAAPVAIGAAQAERVKLVWEAAAGGFGHAVAISRAIGRVAVASGTNLELYDLATGKRVASIAACRDVVRGAIGFAQHKLLIVCETGLDLWDALRLAKLEAPKIEPARVTAAAIAWPRVALGQHDGVVRIYSFEHGSTTAIRVPGPPIDVKSLDLTRDGSKLAVAWVQGSVWWWNTAQPDVPHDLVRHETESDTVAFSDDGALFAEEGRTSFTTVWSFASPPVEKRRLKNGNWIKRLRFTRDSKWLVRGGSDGLELAEIEGPKRVVLDTRGAIEDVAFDEHASAIAAVDRDGRLTVWAVR